MYLYDLVAYGITCFTHILLFVYFIRYERLSYPMILLLSIVFSFLLGFVISITGYPELNFILLFLFLLSLGFMQTNLNLIQNIYFTLASIVIISLTKLILLEVTMSLYLSSPLNFYVWTMSIIHFCIAIALIVVTILLRHKIYRSPTEDSLLSR